LLNSKRKLRLAAVASILRASLSNFLLIKTFHLPRSIFQDFSSFVETLLGMGEIFVVVVCVFIEIDAREA
jgi:hypothetical protein